LTSSPRLRAGAMAASTAALLVGAGGACGARAADEASQPTSVGEIVVTSDRAGLLEKRPSDTVLGLTKPLIETPRSASLVSDLTIERYGIKTINDFVAVSPGAYTASFYGVPGSLNIRGTLADNYFLGFQLIENRGTYTTPIGDAAQIEVVRGPPSPIYGPGKVGGFLNFVPKSARTEDLSHPTGEIEITGGSYDKKNANAQFGAPLKLGPVDAGIYAYGEIDDSGSFYHGIHPKHQLGEVSLDFKFPNNWTWSTDALIYHSSGDVQTAGWNRLTQNLIDNQLYITGHNTTLMNTPGVPYLTPNQATPGEFAPYPNNFTAAGVGLAAFYFGFPPSVPAQFALNSPGAGTLVKLSPQTVDVGPLDHSETMTETLVSTLSHQFADDSTLKLQLFWNGLENQRFVSYGFPAWLRANALEGRLTYDFKLGPKDGPISADTIVGGSYRYYQGRDMQSFNTGLIALDRRDLSVGATPTDTICDPLAAGITGDQVPANCQGWELDIHSRERDGGLFFTTDVTVMKRLDIVLGGRYDWYDVTSSDSGIQSFDTPGPVSASKGRFTYTASGTYKLGWGLMPYVTYSQNAALEVQQAGDLKPADIASGGWLSKSDLIEGGVKFQLVGNSLVGSIDGYQQRRTALAGLNAVSQRTRSDGAEIELRWLATRNLSFTFTGNDQRTEVLGPDTSTVYIPAYAVCGANLPCELGSWGGAYLVFNFNTLPGRAGDYKLSTIPDSVISFHANYVTDEHSWGRAGVTAGVTYVTKTSGTIQNAITYPAYSLVDLSAFYQRGPWEIEANIENLFDTLYFTPNSDPTYVNVSAVPGVGREWRVSLKRRF
jgi:iron complex outermembrane receptor protein